MIVLMQINNGSLIPLIPLRELHLDRPAVNGGGDFLSAASGLVKIEDTFHVVADDSLQLGTFVSGSPTGEIRKLLNRPELPSDEKARKSVKPDLESLTRVKTESGEGLIALGSGSTDKRFSGVFVGLDEHGTLGNPIEFDLAPLYIELGKTFPELNIEGVASIGDKLRLLQRGNGSTGPNAVIDLNLAEAVKAASNGEPLRKDMIDTITAAQLGTTPGHRGPVPWTFTDLAALGDGSSVFTAAAEDTDNPYDDGEILGSAIGFLRADGSVSKLFQTDKKVKLEGIAVQKEGDQTRAFLVTDADDPHKPAMMYQAILPPS
jgi:Family of unknown function (DUF6929)